MSSLRKFLWRLIREEEAQSTTEYILILAVVVVIALKFKSKIGDTMDTATGKISEKINSSLNILDQQ